ncbi:phosphodiester glycosidase family protein [Streptomyces sp. CB01881]|uniref:phosphodiester glycosidase family protein n=1 Tax=Streptomyces sp. CB01881 TaxID=2078691 RepID=UPI0011E051E2|nr:phosphodiester glycosidase family protein [Streptomyces sp. CB01881]TYC66431.1 phosphodiester glycosidase family protein [Streptomyces sp. CB01881]
MMLSSPADDTTEDPMERIATAEEALTTTRTQTSTPFVFSGWEPWYQGIDRAVGTADLAFDTDPPTFPAPVARRQYANALRIGLGNPCVSFYTTPAGKEPQTTAGETITAFLDSAPAVVAAVNANFSWPYPADPGDTFALMGLAVSQGNVVCDPTRPAPPGQTQADVRDQGDTGAMAMWITQANEVTFQVVTAQDGPTLPPGAYTAIAGGPQPADGGWPPQAHLPGPLLLVDNGVNTGTPEATPCEKIAARTAVGLSADKQFLYLVTLDGNEEASWPYGGGFYDIAQWLIIAGADTGLNLDGGGSTAMACRDSNNSPVLMNVPYGTEAGPGVQRVVGNYFGVVSQPLP